MFEESDQDTGLAVGIVLAVAVFAALFAVGIALFLIGRQAPMVPTAATAATAPPAAEVQVTLYFALAEAALPPEAAAALAPVIAAVRANPERRVLVSGYHDKTGDPERNAELAKQRAFAVRDALLAAGVTEDRLLLEKPRQTLGGPDDREARRVDVAVR